MVVLTHISVYVYLFSSSLSISLSVELFYKGKRSIIRNTYTQLVVNRIQYLVKVFDLKKRDEQVYLILLKGHNTCLSLVLRTHELNTSSLSYQDLVMVIDLIKKRRDYSSLSSTIRLALIPAINSSVSAFIRFLSS